MNENSKITVYLHFMRGAGIIIPHPSGIIYSNVAGGVAIQYPSLEGIFIPHSVKDWNREDTACPLTEDLDHYFTTVWGSSCRDGIEVKDADALDAIFLKYEATQNIRIDRDNLSPCKEAWLYVTFISPAPDWLQLYKTTVDFPQNNKAVLTWPNSD